MYEENWIQCFSLLKLLSGAQSPICWIYGHKHYPDLAHMLLYCETSACQVTNFHFKPRHTSVITWFDHCAKLVSEPADLPVETHTGIHTTSQPHWYKVAAARLGTALWTNRVMCLFLITRSCWHGLLISCPLVNPGSATGKKLKFKRRSPLRLLIHGSFLQSKSKIQLPRGETGFL